MARRLGPGAPASGIMRTGVRIVSVGTDRVAPTASLAVLKCADQRLLPEKYRSLTKVQDLMMRQLTTDDFASFIADHPVAVIHFDVPWDVGYRPGMRLEMKETSEVFSNGLDFAEVDCDAQHEIARAVPILNVPTVAYYRDGILVAALIGANQNVRARVERVLRNEPIGPEDGTEAV